MGRGEGHGFRLSHADRQKLGRLVRAGASHDEAAKAVGCSTKAVQRYLAATGGIKDRARPRSTWRLTLNEREAISRGIAAQESNHTIARRLSRSPSTITREINRNGGRKGYRAWRADEAAFRRSARPKPCKLGVNARLRRAVVDRLGKRWSPEQIAKRLPIDFPDEPDVRVSHETIYQSLFVQSRGALRKELTRYLRTGRTQRKPRGRDLRTGRLKDMVLISDRPAEVDDRAVPGHWEGDLIMGRQGRSAIATLVERQSRFILLVPLPYGRLAADVRDALADKVLELPEHLRRTLTWDQGKEMAEHVQLTTDTGVAVYFCDPHSPWQRGTNENTNGLLRQYFPRGSTDFTMIDDDELNHVANELNGRPRATLGWRTPAEILARVVQ